MAKSVVNGAASTAPAAEAPAAPVFIDGEKAMTLRGDNITNEFKAIIEAYVARTYPRKGAPA